MHNILIHSSSDREIERGGVREKGELERKWEIWWWERERERKRERERERERGECNKHYHECNIEDIFQKDRYIFWVWSNRLKKHFDDKFHTLMPLYVPTLACVDI